MKNITFTVQARIFILLLAIIGLGLSLFLVYEYHQPTPIGCPLSTDAFNSCETVRQSPYSTFLGVKLPVWGSMFFIFVITINTIFLVFKNWSEKYNKKIRWGLNAAIIFGILFETAMTLIQIFIIKAVCTWCIMTEMTVLGIFVVNLVENVLHYRRFKREEITIAG